MLRLTVALAAVACASEFSLRIEYPPAGSVVEIEALDHPCSGVKLGIERAAAADGAPLPPGLGVCLFLGGNADAAA